MKKITLIIALLLLVQVANAQDTCASALPITSAGTFVVTAVNGSQVPTPVCADNGNVQNSNPSGEWYAYTPTQNYTVTVTTNISQNNPLVDTRFHVYTGSCGALSCYSGDDDSGASYSSVATFNVMANTTYYIAFDNRWSSNGFTFQLSENTVIPPIAASINFITQYIGTINGSTYNSCAVDMNNDQLDDIVGVSSTNIRIHFQNSNGTFTMTDFPITAGQLPSWSIAAGDYNKDGYNDLLFGAGNGLSFYKSNGLGTGYVQDTPGQYIFCQRTNFIDLNNDGNLDAFSCHDVDPNVYYINNGSGDFTYYQSGITSGAYSLGVSSNGGNYGSVWVDYDNDGDQDLFIAKCGSVPPDELHRNNGNGTFSDISVEMNLYDAGQSWSSAWADYDNDGDMDVMVGASSGLHKLKRNNLDTSNNTEEPFTDITAGSGFDVNTSTNIEHIAYDFNNDGFVDVMGGGNKIMFNQGNGTFTPSSFTGLNVGAVADFNNDGFLDIQNGTNLKINTGNANNWIKVHLQGIQSNSNGIGARVEIYGSWGKQIRDIRSGEGFRYMSTLTAHFGIGTATEIEQVIIRWPSGIVDVISNPAVSAPLLVVEGSTLAVADFNSSEFSIWPNPGSNYINISSNSGSTVVSAEIYDLGGRKVLSAQLDEPKLSVQKLATGTYIILLKDAAGALYTHKFIKN
ncbi:MAG: VCBS repeat-containing protein [Flavisolibacter sp.]|nr:VCBS repeat-containing protein [Flavisolibacter sp.]